MGFSDRQLRALGRRVSQRNIRSRVSAGKELSYIEGWYVVAEANRIFGFDGWDRETVETKCLLGRETRGHCAAVYSARVKVTVRTSDAMIVRDGHGTGEAHGESVGEVHDRALKAAETDATKRALATFGKAFGLALYAGERRTKPKRAHDAVQAVDNPDPLVSDGRHPSVAPSLNGSSIDSHLLRHKGSQETTPVQVAQAGARQPIEKSALALSEPRRIRDKEHLRFVASQPCLLCNAGPSDAHHVRFAQPRALSRKVGDEFTVPLCRAHHRELHHSGNEAAWWHDMGIDPLEIAQQLWRETERAASPSP